ncbi:MAG: putative hydrolase, CocE/NonD family [Firmicutes bacterium]|nr:putative hydrolase, CocE/NonD family [Bacillota bacterium]
MISLLLVLLTVGFTSVVSAEIKPDSPETIKKTQFFFDMFMKGMPEMRNEEGETQEYMVEMRDGVKLYTRVFCPQGDGPWPVVVTRDPYQNGSSTAMSKILVRYGYAVVQQDCRGTGNSEGVWQPFLNERNDGIDNANWVAKQPWSDGNIGMFGHSYGAYVQWIVADQLPKEVKTLYLSMFGTNRHNQMYQDGMFRHDIYTSWAVTTSGIKTTEPLKELYQKALTVRPHTEMAYQCQR